MPSRISKEVEEQVINLYKSGWSYRSIYNYTGVCMTSIPRLLRRNGLTPRPPGGGYPEHFRTPHKDIDRTIFLYHKLGLSTRATAKVLGIGKTAVRRRLTNAGAPPRKGNIKVGEDQRDSLDRKLSLMR